MNDHSVKDMYVKISDIHGDVKAMKQHLKDLDDHTKAQNGRLNVHSKSINELNIGQTELKSRMWVLLLVGSGLGGLAGGLIIKFLGGFI